MVSHFYKSLESVRHQVSSYSQSIEDVNYNYDQISLFLDFQHHCFQSLTDQVNIWTKVFWL